MLWDGRRVPFTLLGGYLGAGKTTVINHLVRHAGGRRLVVLVNDIGAVNVDAELIADHDGATLSLTNGCVCCTIADDFGATLEQVRAMPEPPDQIVMELSGVAEPARVAPWANTTGFRLDGIVVVADADQIDRQLDREFVGDTVRAQLVAADLVVLSKTDVVADRGAAARGGVESLSTSPVIQGDRGQIDIDIVLGIGSPRTTQSDDSQPPPSAQMYATETIDVGSPTLEALRALVGALPPDVVRAKGLIVCSDQTELAEVHVVGTRRNVRLRPGDDRPRSATDLVVIRFAGD